MYDEFVGELTETSVSDSTSTSTSADFGIEGDPMLSVGTKVYKDFGRHGWFEGQITAVDLETQRCKML